MAQVAVICMFVWHCPHCETAVKARGIKTVLSGYEYHLLREHDLEFGSGYDPPIERTHWAFNIAPSDEALHTRPRRTLEPA